MRIFPSLTLIGQGEPIDWSRQVDPELPYEVLVLHEGDPAFLERVFRAAGYPEPDRQLLLLRWDRGTAYPLSELIRRLDVDKIVLFNQDLPGLGLHFRVAPYFPVTVAGRTYLTAESDAEIAAAKTAGDNQPAARLWRALQQGFLRDPS